MLSEIIKSKRGRTSIAIIDFNNKYEIKKYIEYDPSTYQKKLGIEFNSDNELITFQLYPKSGQKGIDVVMNVAKGEIYTISQSALSGHDGCMFHFSTQHSGTLGDISFYKHGFKHGLSIIFFGDIIISMYDQGKYKTHWKIN